AVGPTARSESGREEGTHLGPARGNERDVRRRRRLAVAADPELGLTALAEAAGPDLALGLLRPDLHHQGDPERRQRLDVKGLGARVVGDPEADVIDDHAWKAASFDGLNQERRPGRVRSVSLVAVTAPALAAPRSSPASAW